MKRLPLRFPPWILLVSVVLALSASALRPLHEPRLPGTLRVGVVAGESPAALERAFGPLSAYFGQSVRRSSALVRLSAGHAQDAQEADVMVVPAQGVDRSRVLAWAKPVGRSGPRVAVVLVRRAGPDPVLQSIALGDSTLLGGVERARDLLAQSGHHPSEWRVGASVYRHEEALVLLQHGVVDGAVVRRTELDLARSKGWLPAPEWTLDELAAPAPQFALVAGASLSSPARQRIRERALDLDHLRYSSRDALVGSVLQGLAELGIGGFTPTEPFPSLRP